MMRKSKMSKAIEGLAQMLACRHVWKTIKSKVPGQVVRQCTKCKTREISWSRAEVIEVLKRGTAWPGKSKVVKRAHEARARSPSVRLAVKRSPTSKT